MEELNCGIFDATIELCERMELDMEDLIPMLDTCVRSRLKEDAKENRLVRKKDIGSTTPVLPFD